MPTGYQYKKLGKQHTPKAPDSKSFYWGCFISVFAVVLIVALAIVVGKCNSNDQSKSDIQENGMPSISLP